MQIFLIPTFETFEISCYYENKTWNILCRSGGSNGMEMAR